MKKIFSLFLCVTLFVLNGLCEGTYQRLMVFYGQPSEVQSYYNTPDVDVLYNFKGDAQYLDVLVKSSYLENLKRSGVRYNAVCSNISTEIRDILVNHRGGTFGNYPRYSEMDLELKNLQAKYPNILKLGALSEKSYQGRDIFLVKLSNSPDADNKKPEALISGVQHGDEPIGVPMALNDLKYLCENYNKDYEVTWLVNNRQIYFIPINNPDRYVWNEKLTSPTGRQRKNLNISNGGDETTGGVDPNRNFPFMWGYDNTGSSSTPTATNYRGKAAFSEPETKSIVNFIAQRNIRTWQNHHNAGDYLILPYGYKGAGQYPPNIAIYNQMCVEQKKYYHFAKSGNSGDCYGSWILNGGAEDWGTADSSKYSKTYKVFCIITEINPSSSSYWDFWQLQDSTKLRRRCDSLRGCDIYMMQCAGFFPVLQSLTVKDDPSGGGNNDGKLNPGETVKLLAKIENKSVVDTTPAVTGSLSTANTNIQMKDGVGGYGDFKLLTTVENTTDPFEFRCNPTAKEGDWIKFSLKVTWKMNGVDFEKALPCSLQVGKYLEIVNANSKNIGKNVNILQNSNSVRFKVLIPTSVMNSTATRIISLDIYDAFGRSVKTIRYTTTSSTSFADWDLKNGSGGEVKGKVFFVKVTSGDFTSVQKLVVM